MLSTSTSRTRSKLSGIVILSEVAAERSEAAMQSKDPYL